MPTPSLPDDVLRETLTLWKQHGRVLKDAAEASGLARTTFQSRLLQARERFGDDTGAEAVPAAPGLTVETLKQRVKFLENELKFADKARLDDEYVKSKIIGLGEGIDVAEAPDWLLKPEGAAYQNLPGVPTLFGSDFHWGEVVDPRQIGGVNQFNVAIAHERLRTMIEVSVDILFNHLRFPNYPGIVFALGGDMVGGDIHEELTATNEMEIMPTVINLWEALVWAVEELLKHFPLVFLPCVGGNHGRNTHKIRAKGRNFTSFDWLLYRFLQKRFEAEPRVRFLIPDAADALYSVVGHRYLLTHGDQFRGGDGMIGALGPIIRGDTKKRSRNGQVDMGYDTLMLGHWHQLIQLQRLIVNGSLKGYDEYAFGGNFGFERARQALWLTHANHGITFSAPVNVDRAPKTALNIPWVAYPQLPDRVAAGRASL